MSYSWKLKTIALGSPCCGKTSFLKHQEVFKEESSAITLGVSFESINCKIYDRDGDIERCHATIWDVKPKNRFLFVLPNLLKGSAGCLLFFDLTDRKTFDDLTTWMEFIRVVRGNIPVVLIGTKSDLNPEVNIPEIEEFMIKNEISSYFPTSIQDTDLRKMIIKELITQILAFRKRRYCLEDDIELMTGRYDILEIENNLRRIMGGGNIIINRSFYTLSKQERKQYQDFIEFYSFCPICHKKNHYANLKNLYFNPENESEKLKKELIEIMKQHRNNESFHHLDLSLGIPCCECYKSIFKN